MERGINGGQSPLKESEGKSREKKNGLFKLREEGHAERNLLSPTSIAQKKRV